MSNSALFTENINKQLEVNYMPFVFKKYKIDSLRFSSSNEYYITVIDEYIKIFEEADKRLNIKKDSITKLIKVKDSLRKDSLFKISTQNKVNVNQN
ncbi:MAG: DUF4296 domain-containing protein [Polaribacter sp.]|nr:DUF4296 domain-containing protein [Polaribacter sp.]